MNKAYSWCFKTKHIAIACILAGYSFYTSCSPDSGLGANVLPNNNTLNANFVDTTTVQTSLLLEDSVATNNLPAYFLGSYNDPIFGETKASIYTQMELASDGANPFTAVGSPGSSTVKVILDSVVFAIPYVFSVPNYYGQISPQTVEVYMLDKQLKPDTSYYSNSVISHKVLLGQKTVTPELGQWDSVRYSNTRIEPCPIVFYPRFTVKLNQQWGQKWLDTALSGVVYPGAGDTIFQSIAGFIRNFPGVYVTSSSPLQYPGQGSLWYMNLFDHGAGIFFYCRIINQNNDTTYSIPQLEIGADRISFSHFDHNYNTTSFYAPHVKNAPVSSPDNIYVQGFGGVTTKIKFPYINNWMNKGPIIINKAEVEIPVESQDIGIYTPPAQMYLIGINDTSTVAATSTFTLPDEYTSFYGGTYDPFNKEYVFDIALYIQNVLDKKTIDAGLYLVAGSSAISPNRVSAYGGAVRTGVGSNKRMRLKIYYTPLSSHQKDSKPRVATFPLTSMPLKSNKR